MTTRKKLEFVHEGKYAAEVPVELIEDHTAWSPYLSREEFGRVKVLRQVRWLSTLGDGTILDGVRGSDDGGDER